MGDFDEVVVLAVGAGGEPAIPFGP